MPINTGFGNPFNKFLSIFPAIIAQNFRWVAVYFLANLAILMTYMTISHTKR